MTTNSISHILYGSTLLDGNTTNTGNLIVTGNTSLSNVSVTGNTNTGNLIVTGNTSLSNVSVTGNTNTGNLTVTGNIIIGSSNPAILSSSNIRLNSNERIYQELNPNTNWDKSVNGYYALAKKTYPGLSRASAVKSVSTWTARVPAVDNSWRSVCWSPELGIFVAVSATGTGNRVMTSPDGINWTTRVPAVDNSWFSVCWSPELGIFVAVSGTGTGNRVMTSPDGINWTARVSAADNSWCSVCWSPELGIFVAVSYTGTGNRVMTSPDGINWTARVSAADNSWRSVCWSPELGIFVAVSATGTGNRVMTSSLRGRPPTSYNLFDGTLMRVDENGAIFTNMDGSYNIGNSNESSLDRFRMHSTNVSGAAASYIDSGREIRFRIGTSPLTNRFIISSGGATLLGTINISGSPSSVSGSPFVDYSSSGPSGVATIPRTYNYNLRGDNYLLASGLVAQSDSRIKKNIIDIVDSRALEDIRLIEPKTYNYVDVIKRGSNTVYGFIAQQIRQVLPDAVDITISFIPNIYSNCPINDNVVTLQNHQLLNNDLIQIIVDGIYKSALVRVIDSDRFKVKLTEEEIQEAKLELVDKYNTIHNDITSKMNLVSNEEILQLLRDRQQIEDIIENIENYTSNDFSSNNEIFIYGKQITNFHNIDKSYIFTVNVAATQELDRQLQAVKEENIQLRNIIANMEARLTVLENK